MIIELSDFFNNPSLITLGPLKIQYYAFTWLLSAVFIYLYLKSNEIIVELNEIDAAALKTNIKLEQLAFKIKEVTDLGRAEFRIIVGKSGYEQKIAD